MNTAPAIFIGHGAPRDALRETAHTRAWRDVARRAGRPCAILCVSAHWEREGVFVTADAWPMTIHDFSNYPPEYYRLRYPSPGDPALAASIASRLEEFHAQAVAGAWGLDHGSWTVLKWMYPEADVPVLQLSLDVRCSPAGHHAIGAALRALREEGVMILGSGNIVHNLNVPDRYGTTSTEWGRRFDDAVVEAVAAGDDAALINYPALPQAAKAAPDRSHYLPLIYVVAARRAGESPTIFNRDVMSAVSMTSIGYGIPG